MRQVKISFLSSSCKSEMACISCRIFAGSGSFSARKSLPIHQRRSDKTRPRFARVMTQRNGALPLGQWLRRYYGSDVTTSKGDTKETPGYYKRPYAANEEI